MDETILDLEACARRGDLPGLLAALARGEPVDQRGCGRWNSTALSIAVESGALDCARALLEAGAQVDALDQAGAPALMYAARSGQLGCVKLLLAEGARANRRGVGGTTALGYAFQRDRAECAQWLMALGVDKSELDRLARMAASCKSPSCLKLALDAGADVESVESAGWFVLASAAHVQGLALGDAAGRCVEVLIQAGCDVDRRYENEKSSCNGKSALMMAAEGGSERAVAALLAAGARLDTKLGKGTALPGATALVLAAGHGHVDIASRLLEAGGDGEPAQDDVRKAMAWARELGRGNSVALLEAWLETLDLQKEVTSTNHASEVAVAGSAKGRI